MKELKFKENYVIVDKNDCDKCCFVKDNDACFGIVDLTNIDCEEEDLHFEIKREFESDNYYWVLLHAWQIAYYSNRSWKLVGTNHEHIESDFDEIGEKIEFHM